MEGSTACEVRLLRALHELRQNPDVQVFSTDVRAGGEALRDPDRVFREVGGTFDVTLPDAMKACVTCFSSFSCHWRIEREGFKITGEFNLQHLLKALESEPPFSDWGASDGKLDLYRQFRVIDNFPGGGTASYTALRVNPDLPAPQVWYHDMRRGAVQLDIDYCTYLDMLPVTKGTMGWQYLFSRESLRGSASNNFRKRLERMLTVFPEVFPEYDYSELHARLEARL